MKKLSLLLTLFVLALSFTSCDKEGVYNPNKKISKSYLDTGEGKQLTSSWNWNGKLLRTIDYYDLISGEIAYTHIFSYNDKDQIVSISDITNNLTTKYFYYGNRFDKIVSYHNDEITETYFFEYDDNKISEIKVVENGLFKNTNNTLNPLKFILPEESLEVINKSVLKAQETRRLGGYEIDIEWLGNNISMVEIEYSDNHTEKMMFKYDNMQNPFCDLWTSPTGMVSSGQASKNNVTEMTHIVSLFGIQDIDLETYLYTYDGKFPVSKSDENFTYKFYYEYE